MKKTVEITVDAGQALVPFTPKEIVYYFDPQDLMFEMNTLDISTHIKERDCLAEILRDFTLEEINEALINRKQVKPA